MLDCVNWYSHNEEICYGDTTNKEYYNIYMHCVQNLYNICLLYTGIQPGVLGSDVLG